MVPFLFQFLVMGEQDYIHCIWMYHFFDDAIEHFQKFLNFNKNYCTDVKKNNIFNT